jgi:hypothetical protein
MHAVLGVLKGVTVPIQDPTRTEEHFVTLLSTGLITVFRLFGGPAFAAPDWLFPEPGRQTDPRRPRQSELAKMPMNSGARRARNRARFLLSATLDLWRASFPAQGSQVLRPKPPTVDGADPWAADFKTKGSQAPKRKGVGADNLGQVIGYVFNL